MLEKEVGSTKRFPCLETYIYIYISAAHTVLPSASRVVLRLASAFSFSRRNVYRNASRSPRVLLKPFISTRGSFTYTVLTTLHLAKLAINAVSFFTEYRRILDLQPSLHFTGNYRPHAYARICAFGVRTHDRLLPCRGPYRLIDGDSRVGNPIHRAEDKFHVPQCVSKWETRGRAEDGGARSAAVTSGNYGIGGPVCVRVYVRGARTTARCARPRISNRVHWGMTLGAGNSLQLE